MASSAVDQPLAFTSRSSVRSASLPRRLLRLVLQPLAIPVFLLAVLLVVSITAPLFAPHSPTFSNIAIRLLPPAWMDGANPQYLLGTDRFGRDLLSRIIFGTRVSLTVSVLAILVGGSIGTLLGVVSGYYGGWVDDLIMRITDIALSIPQILIAILFAVLLGPSLENVIIIIGLLLWPRYARQLRGEALSLREQDFVASARVVGCSDWRIMWVHILPNVMPTLLVLASLQVGYVILLEASLSFLGVGVPPPQPSWGSMVADGQQYIATNWWISMFPGLAILFTVLSVNNLGDWIRDRLDPKLRQI